jgi:hypothetical protein
MDAFESRRLLLILHPSRILLPGLTGNQISKAGDTSEPANAGKLPSERQFLNGGHTANIADLAMEPQ